MLLLTATAGFICIQTHQTLRNSQATAWHQEIWLSIVAHRLYPARYCMLNRETFVHCPYHVGDETSRLLWLVRRLCKSSTQLAVHDLAACLFWTGFMPTRDHRKASNCVTSQMRASMPAETPK
eukprot:6186192-Pleurochrysis_carterae.AAC.3